MIENFPVDTGGPCVGAVNYLNAKPLICGLEDAPQQARLMLDLPSRLADSLAAGRLDVALIPSVELFRNPHYTIVSNACIACRGPVLSVKLFFRVPPAKVRRIALDEGSRTSGALALILLDELHKVSPEATMLPIGATLSDSDADAILLIGDRAMRGAGGSFVDVWDLGDRWCRWAELPFVFAMWVARPGSDPLQLADLLSAARDRGLEQLTEIAQREAALLDIDVQLAERYLRHSLHFSLGERERKGLKHFYQLCAARDFVPRGLEHMIRVHDKNDCAVR